MVSEKKDMKPTKKLGIVIFLILIGIIIGLAGYQDSFITSLSVTQSLPYVQKSIPVLPSVPYNGEFVASYDRLGIVKIRIGTQGRINTNTLVFRLREKGQKTWLVENNYITDRFIDGERYPFGFPIISDSKGKTYEYELTTTDGSRDNTVLIIPGTYSLQTDYIYSKAIILNNRQTTLWFLKEKLKELYGTVPRVGYWMLSLLPVLFITPVYIIAGILMIFLFGLLSVQIHSNIVLWIGASVLISSLIKKNYALPFLLALITLLISIAAHLTQTYYLASKLATIIPILLIAGGISTIVGLRR